MQKQKLAYLYLALTVSAWGSLYVVGKVVLEKVPPFTLLFLRYLIAGVILAVVLKHRKPVKIAKEDYKYLCLLGFVGYFFSIGAQLLGTKLSSASMASLINSMNPVVIILFATLILKEKLTKEKVVAVVAAIVGTYIVLGGVKQGGQWVGVLFSLLSVIAWAWMSTIVRRITQKYDSLAVTTYGILIAMGCALPVSIYELAVTPDVRLFEGPVLAGVLYIGLICTALSHFLWNKSLSMIEAGNCGLFYPIQPMVSVALGSIFLGEHVSAGFIMGAVLIIGGVLVSILGKKLHSALAEGQYQKQ